MNKKNGFTLVELLAVIVILAVILVIAVPQIMNVITESKKGVLESSVKLIASSAESMKISNDTLGIDREITCSDVANISSEDYKTCKIDFINGKAHVSIVGKGKFEGMGVLLGTKDNVISTYGLEEDDTDHHNIRYVGSNPSNYVEFGNDGELWRIIGIFNMTTADGKQEKLMKIVRNESIGRMSWDSSESNVNEGKGVNQWGEVKDSNGNEIYSGADLMRELNTLYLNSESGTCFNDSNNASTTCNFSTTGIKDTYRGMIEDVVWNTGGVDVHASGRNGQSAITAYQAERGTRNGKECTSGTSCNDIVARTTDWTGQVGLIYPSDYGYASTNTDCRNWINANATDKSYCKNDNWLHNNQHYWTLSPTAHYSNSNIAWIVFDIGYVGTDNGHFTRYPNNVRPSVYLKSNVSIMSGEGTEARPYKLSMN